MPLKHSRKGRCLFTSIQIDTLKRLWSAAVWAASSKGRLTLRDSDRATEIQLHRGRLTSKEASKEPIRTCMTLFCGTCVCCYLWDYFFILSSKCNIFLLMMRKQNTMEQIQAPVAAICLMTLAYIKRWASMLPPIWLWWSLPYISLLSGELIWHLQRR